MISELKKRYGAKCMGLKVNHLNGYDYTPDKPIRFCEAVYDAFKMPLLFNPQNLLCLGAKRSMGIMKNDEELVQHIELESGIDSNTIRRAVSDIPHLDEPIENILMGIDEEMERDVKPDMYIMFISPREVMELMKYYTEKLKSFPVVKPYTFLSVCGSVFVSTYKTGLMSISFGCPESRYYGGVKDNLLVVGLPYNSCVNLFS